MISHRIEAVIFDAYGTLFDIYSVSRLIEEAWPGQGAALAVLWRDKQIEYTRLRTMSGRYADFWTVTSDALRYACDRLKLQLNAADATALMNAYAVLPAYPEVRPALEACKANGQRLAILSNGTPAMLDKVVANAGLDGIFDAVLSVDSVKKFKTAPEAYQMACDVFDSPAAKMVFVSSNAWDVCGAAWFGYRTYWVNRFQLPMERLGVEPDTIAPDLTGLSGFLGHSREDRDEA